MKVQRLFQVCVAVVVATLSSATVAQVPVMDGSWDSAYGTALSIQNTDTQFGNAGGMPDTVYPEFGGNEIDQVFATVANGRLHVLVAGNMSGDFTKLNFFFDSEPNAGVNQLDGMALPSGVDSFCCGGLDQDGALQRMNGLKFDAGFDADHLVLFTHGTETALNPTVSFWAASAHYGDLRNGVNGVSSGLGMQLAPQGLPNVLRLPGSPGLSGDPIIPIPALDGPTEDLVNNAPPLPGLGQGELIDRNYVFENGGVSDGDDSGAGAIAAELPFALDVDPNDPGNNSYSHRRFNNVVDLQMALDNSNIEGVDDAAGMTEGNPQDVLTGVEISIPLSEIGATAGTDIKLLAFINGQVHDFASNQFSGVGVLQGNLEGYGFDLDGNPNIDLSMIDGDQFVTISIPALPNGDFDNNMLYECADVDALVQEIVDGTNNSAFDMNGDTVVDEVDLTAWLAQAGAGSGSIPGLTASGNPVLPGDANLDGTVDGPDFLVWNTNKFSDGNGWCGGDFNADGTTDGPDFLIWNTNKFQTADGFSPVPEPGGGLLVLLAMSLIGIVQRRR